MVNYRRLLHRVEWRSDNSSFLHTKLMLDLEFSNGDEEKRGNYLGAYSWTQAAFIARPSLMNEALVRHRD